MTTAFDSARRAELVGRFNRLTAQTTPRWGRFTAVQMAAHLTEALRMAIGELAVAPKGPKVLATPLVRWLVLHVFPFPKGAPTAPELIRRGASDVVRVEEEQAAFAQLLDRFAAKRGTAWPRHPAFGQLTERDWGVLVYKHTDHHLRQFGL
ncbi:MAG: DUF1569 domain-containing protein [Gemmatimonadota bacterium]|nr:DUF1569 domain-containing protein [Gemmatimonadota bacterium]